MKKIIVVLSGIIIIFAAVTAFYTFNYKCQTQTDKNTDTGKIYGFGYVRGRSATTLKNKYAGYVTKVHFYNYAKVKKGDVIIEYDDLPIRTAITEAEHAIAEQEKKLELLKLKRDITRIDPLPSTYRNLQLKYQSAKATLDRSAHEHKVYRQLSKNKIVADLTYRQKMEDFKSAEAELRQLENDLVLLKKGLTELYIKQSEAEVLEAEIKLKNLREKLALLKEEQKYYKIVAPYDGVTITYSDTVHGYNAAATSAVVVHRIDRKYVYSYFSADDVRHLHVGDKLKFISNDQPRNKQGTVVQIFDINTARTTYGDKVYFLVKCRVIEDPHDLLVDTLGTLEFEVK